jgi:hypothetical protein
MNKVKGLLFTIIILAAAGTFFAVKATRRNTAFCTTAMRFSNFCPGDSCGRFTTLGALGSGANICFTPFSGQDCKKLCPIPGNMVFEH